MASRFRDPFGGGRGRGVDPFRDLGREIGQLFGDTMREFGAGQGRNTQFSPSIDVCEHDKGLEVSVDLPGIAREAIDLQLEGDVLTISGEKPSEHKDHKVHVAERPSGSFRRALQLPFIPDPGQVTAEFTDGVLRIMLLRPAEQGRAHRVPIGGGA